MAPSNVPVAVGSASQAAEQTSTKNKTVASKPVSRRRVEPVIPLPYMQRRPKHPSTSTQLPSSPLRTSSANSPPTPKQNNGTTSPVGQMAANANGVESAGEVTAATSPQSSEHDDAGVTTASTSNAPRQETEPVTAATQTQESSINPLMGGEITPPDTAPSAPSSASFVPPAMSPNPYNMRPPFHNVNNHPMQLRGPIPDPIRLPQHPLNPPRMHQPHPSNGSLIFGGFHGSNTSSPVPNSAGAFPPPMLVPHDQIPVTNVDAFGRSMLSTASLEGHAPVAMNHGPLTPHSLHGSQSSRNAEDFVTKSLINGHNSMDMGRPGPPPTNGRVQYHPNGQPPFPDSFEVGEVMDFANFVSSMFARPEFADCEIVLVIPDRLTTANSQYPGSLNGPLRLPGHQLILSNNPILHSIIQDQPQQVDGPREVRIVSDDPYIRADAMWRAIKYVYGYRYVSLPHALERESELEQFNFSLGYAAAGALLEVPHISINAIREASKLLSWDTVEKAFEFAMTDSTVFFSPPLEERHLFPQFRYKHGIYVGELVDKIIMFLVTQFPSNFTLDTAVEEPRYARLPLTQPISLGQNGPEIPNHNRTTSINIKFGDMDLGESNGRGQPPPQQPGGYVAALSRILINLPFEMLKFLLESNGFGGVSGWQTVQDRRRVTAAVIAEREARRHRFRADMASGKYPSTLPIEKSLRKGPHLFHRSWNNVCWREECHVTAETPIIVRNWEPLEDRL